MHIRKQWLFKMVTLLLPFILLLTVELLLRLFNVWSVEPLFLQVNKQSRSVYQLNPEVGQRYFSASMSVPRLYPQTFAQVKGDNTVRIFCLGGSTTAGFPFEATVPFPFQLERYLSAAKPTTQFEVINAGLSAVNSYTVLDLLPEIMAVDPDLLVIYMGHNEFYGAYGSASAQSIGQNGWLIRWYLDVQKWRIVQGVKRFIGLFAGDAQPSVQDQTLMEQVIGQQEVQWSSPTYQKTLANFSDNLTKILQAAEKNDVPVYLGTLTANVRDMQPLQYAIRKPQNLPSTILSRADTHFKQGHYESSLPLYRDLLQTDSANAYLWYQIGKCYRATGDSVQAARYLHGALRRDALRFRADKSFNSIIMHKARLHSVVLVDIAQAFNKQTPTGLPGDEIFCDHLHPNPYGYRLMAEEFTASILKNHFEENEPFKRMQDHHSVITPLDWEIGLIKIHRLMQRWPFADRPIHYNNYQPYGDSATFAIAYDFVHKHHNWPRAHYRMASLYKEHRQWANARRQYVAVSVFYPHRADPLEKIAEIDMRQKRWRSAQRYLEQALPLSRKQGTLYLNLAKCQWNSGQFAPAVQSIQKAIVAPEMNITQESEAMYYLAVFLTEGGRYKDALKVLDDLLNMNPDYQPAQRLHERLQNRP
ncbi:MAG: tetratricopeptide repeat protein [Caldithrix sp.]|nr:tetratricopeptide repeat protein [Caldithrix sp.]